MQTETPAQRATDLILSRMQSDRAARPIPPTRHLICAMTLLDLWDAPPVVRDYLATSAPELREAAETAAWAVANASTYGCHANGSNAAKCAARAVAHACAGDNAPGLLRAGGAARGFAAGASLLRSGDWMATERAAAEAFRRCWEPMLLPIAAREAA